MVSLPHKGHSSSGAEDDRVSLVYERSWLFSSSCEMSRLLNLASLNSSSDTAKAMRSISSWNMDAISLRTSRIDVKPVNPVRT